MDHNPPTLIEVAEAIKDPNALVVPMLLSKAFHAKFDVPKAMREAGLVNGLEPIGHPEHVLRELISRAKESVVVCLCRNE
ncbi:MAG: hypothetical protein WDO06_04975 [Actinomycetota bacterium]